MKNIIRVVGAFEIFGGIVGAKATIVAMVAGSHGLNFFIYAAMVLFFSISIIAGILLIEKRVSGFRLSKYIQIMQIPIVTSPLISYLVINGIGLPIYIGNPSGINFLLDVDWQIQLLSSGGFAIGANLMPVLALYFLKKASAENIFKDG